MIHPSHVGLAEELVNASHANGMSDPVELRVDFDRVLVVPYKFRDETPVGESKELQIGLLIK